MIINYTSVWSVTYDHNLRPSWLAKDRKVNYTARYLQYWYAAAVVNYASSGVIYDHNNVCSTGHWL
jgi:hypothetical protein